MTGSTALSERMDDHLENRDEAWAKGMVRGRFVTGWVDQIKQMIRARRDDDALALLLECIDASRGWATADHGGMGGPWYTTAAAGIYRRRKEYQSEVNVLTSYLTFTDGTGFPTMRAALRKAEARLESAREAELPPACPACGSVWDEWPATKTVCPECGCRAVVRKINGYPKLLTIAQDAARKKVASYDREREKMLVRVGYLGVNEAAWDAKCAAMPGRTMREVYLQLGNEAVAVVDTSGNFAVAHTYLWEMAKLEAEAGRPWVELMRAGEARMNAGLWSRYPPGQQMVIMGCSCHACLAMSGRWTVGEYLREGPVPHSGCLQPPCRCALQLFLREPGLLKERAPGSLNPCHGAGGSRSGNR